MKRSAERRTSRSWIVVALGSSVLFACSSTTTERGRSPEDGTSTGGSASGDAGGAGQGGASGANATGGGGGGCQIGLDAIACPRTYDDAAATQCPANPDGERSGTCGAFRVYGYGHDGTVNCGYDATGALVGGVDSRPIHGTCLVLTAGAPIPNPCSLTPVACPIDAGADGAGSAPDAAP